MRTIRSLAILFVFTVIIFALPATSQAESGKKTYMTFNQPVQIPGVVLAPGTYVFKTIGPDNRMVQVLDAQNHIIATVMTTYGYRVEPTEKAAAKFDESSKGAPQALKQWFNPGQTVGQEFVYGTEATK